MPKEKTAPEPPKQLRLEAKATVSLEAKAAEGDGPPPLPRFEITAYTGGLITQWWAKYPLVMDLGGLKIPSQNIPVRFAHDAYSGVGHTDAVSIQDGQLLATGVVSRDTEAAKDVVSSSRRGFPWQASVGASIDQMEFIKDGTSVTVNGQTYEGPLNVVTKSTLGEISFVDLGADGNTRARVAAMAKDGEQDPPLGGNGSVPATVDGAAAIDQALDRYEKEQQRQRGIEALVVEALGYRGADSLAIKAISKQAIEEFWDVQKTHLQLLIARRPQAPAPRTREIPTPKVMEASLLLHCGVKDSVIAKDLDYGPEVTAQAWPLRSRGLRGTIAAALEASGARVPHGSRELFEAILDQRHTRHIQAEGFSTVNLPGILGNVANKILLNAFTNVDVVYDTIADQADFANFHIHSIYRLDHLGDFAEVPPAGEIKHGRLSQTAFTSQLATYGQIIAITRQDIINDDLNAFRSITTTLARKARLAVEKALITLVMESADTFYTTGQGNRLTGALGLTELAAAETAMLSMADSGGDPIYATPRYLLVPPGLKSVAQSIFMSELLQGATTSTRGQPATNTFRGRFDVATSPFLASSALPGSSATTWYLLADPANLPAFQVGYLDGRRAPTVETADAEFDTLGLQMRCYFDFAVARLDYRGAIKSTAT